MCIAQHRRYDTIYNYSVNLLTHVITHHQPENTQTGGHNDDESDTDLCDRRVSYGFSMTQIKNSPIYFGIKVDCQTQHIIVEAMGPSNVWFGVGYGTGMENTDAFIYTKGDCGACFFVCFALLFLWLCQNSHKNTLFFLCVYLFFKTKCKKMHKNQYTKLKNTFFFCEDLEVFVCEISIFFLTVLESIFFWNPFFFCALIFF